MTRIALSLLVAASLMSSCEESRPRAEPVETQSPEWEAPPDYDYVVRSRCGEQSFIGTFRIAVRDGRVERVKPLDESAGTAVEYMRRDEIPTLEDLVGRAETARADGADVAEITYAEGGGHPALIDIDYSTSAIDDESCFEISRYEPR